LLNSNQIEYLLVGGYAVGYHGYPRATADLDIWIAVHLQNRKEVVSVLKEFGFDLPELNAELFADKNRVIRMGIPPIQIELLTSLDGVVFEECYKNRIQDLIDGVEVNLINKHFLKINKKVSGRYKDLNDLEHLT
jgi:hypothetical protein